MTGLVGLSALGASGLACGRHTAVPQEPGGSLAWVTSTQETGICLGSTVLIHAILALEAGATET